MVNVGVRTHVSPDTHGHQHAEVLTPPPHVHGTHTQKHTSNHKQHTHTHAEAHKQPQAAHATHKQSHKTEHTTSTHTSSTKQKTDTQAQQQQAHGDGQKGWQRGGTEGERMGWARCVWTSILMFLCPVVCLSSFLLCFRCVQTVFGLVVDTQNGTVCNEYFPCPADAGKHIVLVSNRRTTQHTTAKWGKRPCVWLALQCVSCSFPMLCLFLVCFVVCCVVCCLVLHRSSCSSWFLCHHHIDCQDQHQRSSRRMLVCHILCLRHMCVTSICDDSGVTVCVHPRLGWMCVLRSFDTSSHLFV